MPSKLPKPVPASLSSQLAVLAQPRLLLVYAMTALGYGGSFTAFTFLAPMLENVTASRRRGGADHAAVRRVGRRRQYLGRPAGRPQGPVAALKIIFAGLSLVLLALSFTAVSKWLVALTVLAWGAVAFGNVAGLQLYVVQLARARVPHAVDVASGLNIAAFNVGIAGGAWLGGHVVASLGLMATPWVGAAIVLGAWLLTAWSGRLDAAHASA
ncbi:Inner membrane transport protein ydhP [Chromobacterium violaceum]|uniref:Inner membrane transport protein ydhP n=1 Tax=Chromobacterium violaceum TaxID=536 RepID=A0A3S5DL61_CHRVL|nr:Inner membrane transport protein ydhP [Chromobacterium violaceum]